MHHLYNLLTETEGKVLREIGEGNVKPFPWNRKFYSFSGEGSKVHFLNMFAAPLDSKFTYEKVPKVQVGFEEKDSNERGSVYSVGFGLEENELQLLKTDIKYYLRIISTVVRVVEAFIEKYEPGEIEIHGVDKRDVMRPGQKNRIYFAYLEKNANRMGYNYGLGGENTLVLTKKR